MDQLSKKNLGVRKIGTRDQHSMKNVGVKKNMNQGSAFDEKHGYGKNMDQLSKKNVGVKKQGSG